MKRYWLFCGECYYATGGMNDFSGSFDSVDEAMAAFESSQQEWCQVFDSLAGEVSYREGLPYGGEVWPGEETSTPFPLKPLRHAA